MNIPFHIPANVLTQVAAGALYRDGAFIKDAGTHRIVRILQETAALTANVTPLGMATRAVDAGAKVVTIVQNEQIKRGLATLQTLGLANLALTATGIGVSVAGFALVTARLDRLSADVGAMAERLDRIARSVDDLRLDAIRRDLVDLTTECQRVDEAWSLADPAPQWRDAADHLHRLQNRVADRARVAQEAAEPLEVWNPLVDAVALAGSTRVAARLAAGDEMAARAAGEDLSRSVAALTEDQGSASLLRGRLSAAGVRPGGADYAAQVASEQALAQKVGAQLREREARLHSMPLLLSALADQTVSGRDWLEAARSSGEPLIALTV